MSILGPPFVELETGEAREIVLPAGLWTAAYETLRTSITSFVEGCVEWISPKENAFWSQRDPINIIRGALSATTAWLLIGQSTEGRGLSNCSIAYIELARICVLCPPSRMQDSPVSLFLGTEFKLISSFWLTLRIQKRKSVET
ncbi:hypothetical protein [Rhizobium leguminosarum]|uniref:hypothetical protein n=1 Tax=Rhizobium leguminosarum TaxID=384 RepID=UPI003F98A2F8